jgi:hypothetical protein
MRFVAAEAVFFAAGLFPFCTDILVQSCMGTVQNNGLGKNTRLLTVAISSRVQEGQTEE